MGKIALGCAFGLVAVVACGGPTERGGAGASCRRDADCAYGTVCASIEGAPRLCTTDVRGLFAQENPALPGQGGVPSTPVEGDAGDRKSTRLNSSHVKISYAVFCLKKK